MKLNFLRLTIGAFLIFISSTCNKEVRYMTDAIITGYDIRACSCCGGLMMTFDGTTQPYQGNFKLIADVTGFNIKENDSFPIYVSVDTVNEERCFGKYIKITRLERR